MSDLPPLLLVRNLRSDHFGPVSLELRSGERMAIAGPSGAGKSLLMRAIADLDPHHGDVFLDGTSCITVEPAQWRRQVGLLPAESGWWALRVRDHFPEGEPRGLEALGFAPDAMDWQVSRLSSGERQRLALLRLLANRPRVLLLDEPTANLDPASAAAVERLVLQYLDETGACALWTTHDAGQARRVAQRLARIEKGVIAHTEAL